MEIKLYLKSFYRKCVAKYFSLDSIRISFVVQSHQLFYLLNVLNHCPSSSFFCVYDESSRLKYYLFPKKKTLKSHKSTSVFIHPKIINLN